jgi:sortase A
MSLTVTIPGKTLRRTRKSFFSAAYCVFLTVGVLALFYAGATTLENRWYQASEQAHLQLLIPEAPAALAAAVVPAAVAEGSVLGRLEVPRLGMNVVFAEGVSNSILRRAVGHVPQTALPGQPGNVALAGHRDTFFRPLRKIEPGDAIALKTAAGEFTYEVESTVIVAPTDIGVLRPTRDPMLTLVTCFPFSYVGPAPDRFVVRARLVSNPPPPRPAR